MKLGRGRWHVVAGLYVAVMVGLAALDASGYYTLVQEDGPVEWATVGLFAVAGVVRLRAAWRGRHLFDGLVGAFCLFVAGEEISWGQRLVGYTPPEQFLAANFQQEANVHNFVDVFGRPGLILAALLLAYGVLLPAVSRWSQARGVLDRLGASAPPAAAAPWFAG
nr:hypothetical protein [Gemmatimonadota bacterium]NIQ54036.1 hypothetical protein [Gemmatimonadota bacterium]NIU74220.1 hypothetical protein [Gammaproteobacteria bacterium]NIX44248.1 hypothetical protein [Gemmatimonadota bacterium]NIY08467.1 hypothetical protein [Gemmatimonadota bacterium]